MPRTIRAAMPSMCAMYWSGYGRGRTIRGTGYESAHKALTAAMRDKLSRRLGPGD